MPRRRLPLQGGKLPGYPAASSFIADLKQFGIEEQRCRLDFVAASEGEKCARVLTEMVESLRTLGPLVLDTEVMQSGGAGPA
jgi:Methyl-viologen-reducing hydrogenase, delta subunit